MLSKEFTIAKTENVLNDILTSLSSTVLYRRDKSYKTFSVIDFTLKDLSVLNSKLEKDDKLSLFLFKLMSNIDPLATNTNTELSFSLVNAFGGEHTLCLSYGLLTKFSVNIGGVIQTKNINNLIVLDSFSTRLIHNASMTVNISDITDVKNKIEEKITRWKSILIEDDELKMFEDNFSKKFMIKFMGVFSGFPDEIKNLFYVSYLLSYLIENEKNVNLYRSISLILEEIEKRNKVIEVKK